MSDFAFNNWDFANFIKKYGKNNKLKNISSQGVTLPTNPASIDWQSPASTLREPTNYNKPKHIPFTGVPLNTTRPTTPLPPPPGPVLVVYSNNQNIFINDQQICGLDYYQ